jgi:hypothetical protein
VAALGLVFLFQAAMTAAQIDSWKDLPSMAAPEFTGFPSPGDSERYWVEIDMTTWEMTLIGPAYQYSFSESGQITGALGLYPNNMFEIKTGSGGAEEPWFTPGYYSDFLDNDYSLQPGISGFFDPRDFFTSENDFLFGGSFDAFLEDWINEQTTLFGLRVDFDGVETTTFDELSTYDIVGSITTAVDGYISLNRKIYSDDFWRLWVYEGTFDPTDTNTNFVSQGDFHATAGVEYIVIAVLELEFYDGSYPLFGGVAEVDTAPEVLVGLTGPSDTGVFIKSEFFNEEMAIRLNVDSLLLNPVGSLFHQDIEFDEHYYGHSLTDGNGNNYLLTNDDQVWELDSGEINNDVFCDPMDIPTSGYAGWPISDELAFSDDGEDIIFWDDENSCFDYMESDADAIMDNCDVAVGITSSADGETFFAASSEYCGEFDELQAGSGTAKFGNIVEYEYLGTGTSTTYEAMADHELTLDSDLLNLFVHANLADVDDWGLHGLTRVGDNKMIGILYIDDTICWEWDDLDCDGVPNDDDAFPGDIAASVDEDGDGVPDEFNADACYGGMPCDEESFTTELEALDNNPTTYNPNQEQMLEGEAGVCDITDGVIASDASELSGIPAPPAGTFWVGAQFNATVTAPMCQLSLETSDAIPEILTAYKLVDGGWVPWPFTIDGTSLVWEVQDNGDGDLNDDAGQLRDPIVFMTGVQAIPTGPALLYFGLGGAILLLGLRAGKRRLRSANV